VVLERFSRNARRLAPILGQAGSQEAGDLYPQAAGACLSVRRLEGHWFRRLLMMGT
jgi:hypothetical protein